MYYQKSNNVCHKLFITHELTCSLVSQVTSILWGGAHKFLVYNSARMK